MKDAFGKAVREAIAKGATMHAHVVLLREWHARGLAADDALAALEALRPDLSNADEDRLLEVMDIVSGHCHPDLRLWNST